MILRMSRTTPITGGCWERARSAPDRWMRSASEDVRDNITRTERGPLGAGGGDAGQGAALGGGIPLRWSWSSKDGENVGVGGHGGVSLNPGAAAEGPVPNCTVPAA